MALTKHGTGEVIQPDDNNQKTAAQQPEWTEQDQVELDKENDQK